MFKDGHVLTDNEIEAYVNGMYDLMLYADVMDGHCKSYDPITIERPTIHSYVFDLWDGGRHHDATGKSTEEILKWFRDEAVTNLKAWRDDK